MKKNSAIIAVILVCGLILSSCVDRATQTAVPLPPEPTIAATISATAVPATVTPEATPTPVGEPANLLRIDMVDTTVGWAVGTLQGAIFERVLRTNDGGITWQDVTPAERADDAGGVDTAVLAAFSGANMAWVMYYAPVPEAASEAYFVYHTSDGGKTWQTGEPLDLNNMIMEFFLPGEMGFSDPQNGWVLAHLGAGMHKDYVALYTTADSGQNWTRVLDPQMESGLSMSCSKTGVSFVDSQTGWITGNCNGVMNGVFFYRSVDGGVNWQQVELTAPAAQPGLLEEWNTCGADALLMMNADTMYLPVSCMMEDFRGTRWLYRSYDGGESWTPKAAALPFGALDLAPMGVLWQLGSTDRSGEVPRTLYSSTDDSETWDLVLEEVLWDGQLNFVDAQNGWALVNLGETRQLLRSADNGRTWTEIPMRVITH